MPKKERGPVTWLEVAIGTAGIRKAVKGFTWAYTWAVVREAVGHDPSVDEVAEWWRASSRSVYRDQAAFRECFPQLDTPAKLYEAPELRAKIRQTIKTMSGIEQSIKKRRLPRDSDVMEAGMMPAAV